MNIIVGKSSGFCAGVKHTITKTEEELDKSNSSVDCLGSIIHNKQVIDDLEKKGLRIIDSIEDARSKLIIRAHGVPKSIYEIAKAKDIELIDLTCPNVLKIHNQVSDFSNNNYFIFLLGIKNHPETIATFSFCGDNACLIESESDIDTAISKLKSTNLTNVFIVSQTTYSLSLFDSITSKLNNLLSDSYNIVIEKSICKATSIRQSETKEISSKVDLMIIIGGQNSSNTHKLYEVANENCKNAILIQTKDDLDINFVKQFENVGIMAGASTPDYVINDVYNAISN